MPERRSNSRPADAAGLVLLRARDGIREVLMGRRRRSLRFMPGVYVVPGGRLEREDARPSPFPERQAGPPAGTDRATGRRWNAFLRAALRETFEETGVLLGRPAGGPLGARPGRAARGLWRGYADHGLEPAFADLRLVARAITPAVSPIRFHTRFFLADGALAAGTPRNSGELEDVRWIPVAGLDALPLPGVTRMVLRECLAPAARDTGRPACLFRWVGADQRPRHRGLSPA